MYNFDKLIYIKDNYTLDSHHYIVIYLTLLFKYALAFICARHVLPFSTLN